MLAQVSEREKPGLTHRPGFFFADLRSAPDSILRKKRIAEQDHGVLASASTHRRRGTIVEKEKEGVIATAKDAIADTAKAGLDAAATESRQRRKWL